MTKVTIDIRNIASSTHADDRVFFRAPVVREAPSGGLVNTANEVVTLTDGVGDVELTPGPVIVTFQCKGVADTSPKRGTVPDSGTVELSQVISGSFSYSPEVVTAAQAARDDAQDAAGQAKDYRDQAGDSADAASTASSTAVSSASTAVTKAGEAAASATTATTAASTATSARDEAVQAATDTTSALSDAQTLNWYKGVVPADATLDDLPRGTYQISYGVRAEQLGLPPRVGSLEIGQSYNGTKTATAVVNLVAGNAHEVWTNTQSGVSGAWMGWRKSVLTDPASSTANLDLRLDTTVGTRILAGNTMIHGELPWRDISALLGDGWSGQIHARRDGNIATIRLEGVKAEADASVKMIQLPYGVRPNVSSFGARWVAHMATYPATFWRGQIAALGQLTVISLPTGTLYGDISFPTPAVWPSTWA